LALACAIMIAVAAGIVAKPLLSPPMVHDSFWIDYVWARQFAAELAEGNFYPRWLPSSFGGLGAPVFYFYPPVAFYLVAMLDLAGFATYPGIILVFGLSFFASGAGAYLLFRRTARWPLAGALLFMVAPYHLLDFTVRGALGESVAIALLPFLLIGLGRIAEGKGWHLACLCYASMILTHLPFALLASLFVIAPFAVMKRERLVPTTIAVGIALGLAAIYLVPAIMLAPFRDEAQLYNEARLLPGYWSLYAGNWNDPFFVGIHLVIASIAVPAALLAVRDRDWRLIYALAICALAAGLVPLFWSLPTVLKVQFSFRALPFAEIALAAYVAHRGRAQGKRLYLLALPLVAGWAALAMVIPTQQSLADLDRLMPDVPEYLPPGVLAERPAIGEWPDLRLGRVPPPDRGADTIVEPIFYFPIWSCGTADPATKLLAHPADCRPRRIDAPTEGWSRIVSAVSLLILAALWLGRRRKVAASNKSGLSRSRT